MSCLGQTLGTTSGPDDFQLLFFFIAVCNSSRLMSSHGWYSVSAPLSLSTLLNSCTPLFSKMKHQHVSVASYLSCFSTDICSLPRFLTNLFFIVCKHLVLTELFTSSYMSPDSLGFCLNFHFEVSCYCLQFLVCCYFVFTFNSLFFLGDLLGFTFLCHIC